MIHNTIRPKDLLIAHAFATLTTSPEFGETPVSDLTPAPYSLDKFLHLTDTGSSLGLCIWNLVFNVVRVKVASS